MDVTFVHRTRASMVPVVRAAGAGALESLASHANRPRARSAQGPFSVAALRSFVRDRLPDFMVPGAFLSLDALPLTPNGKIDRAALPAPDHVRERSEVPREPPRNEIERGIIDVLRELTAANDVGAEDNFFDVGANSLILVQASVRLRTVLGRPVPLVKLFQFPTARSLAAAMGEGDSAERTAVPTREESQERAQVRRDALQAMQRKRAAGGNVRPRR
jgi:acyl carrier protein